MPHKRPGSEVWQIRVNGVRKSAETTDWKAADALEKKLNLRVFMDEKMGVKPPRSWAEAVLKWLDEKGGKETIDEDRKKLDWLDQYLGKCEDLNTITREVVHGFMQKREGVTLSTASAANATANRYVSLVSAILRSAELEWEWGNRAPRLKKYKERAKGTKGHALTLAKWRKLEAQLNPHMKLCATFSIATGMREAKVFGLEWSQIDFDNRCLSYEGNENKLPNTIPLNATAMRVLQDIRKGPVVHATHVFVYAREVGRKGAKKWKIAPMQEHGQKAWENAVERAGIGATRWHDLRHTFISWLAQNGVPKEYRKRLAGHATEEVHDDYTHFEVDHLRQYSAVIDKVLRGEKAQLRKVG